MATIMTKQGNLDNVVTYEHICDTFEDIQSIDPHYVTLGSTCVVINGESGGLEIYMADSNKEWQNISISSESSGDIGIGIHICGNDEYDSTTGEPTVEDPIENQFYLVPSSSSDSSNLFDEWIYINGSWEKFGGGSIDIPQQKQADWTQESDTDESFIKNKPSIRSGVGSLSILESSATSASGVNSHAEGANTTASGTQSHAEGAGTIANHLAQHVFGRYNIADDSVEAATNIGNYVEIIGNGTGDSARSNARTLDWNGNQEVAGDVIANACGGANPISLVGIANNMIAVQNTQPTAPETKLWISETTQTPVQVPTVQEMNSAIENAAIDVQVNGVSVVQDGVANVPIATSNQYGVVKLGQGLTNINDLLYVDAAGINSIKSGTSYYNAIPPARQHLSVFYGLAKAAGSDEKDSALPLGQYTDAAKSAIQNMLGFAQILSSSIETSSTASSDHLPGSVFAYNGSLYKATSAIASGTAIIPDTNCVITTVDELITGTINDSAVVSDKTWSSQKINATKANKEPHNYAYDGTDLSTIFADADALYAAYHAEDYSHIHVGDYWPVTLNGTYRDYGQMTAPVGISYYSDTELTQEIGTLDASYIAEGVQNINIPGCHEAYCTIKIGGNTYYVAWDDCLDYLERTLSNAIMKFEIADINPYWRYGDSGDLTGTLPHLCLQSRDGLPHTLKMRKLNEVWENQHIDTFTGDGVQSEFTLSGTVGTIGYVFVNGTKKTYNTHYTYANDKVTFKSGSIPANGDVVKIEWCEGYTPWNGSALYRTFNDPDFGIINLIQTADAKLYSHILKGTGNNGMRYQGETRTKTNTTSSVWTHRGRLFLPEEDEIWGRRIYGNTAGYIQMQQWALYRSGRRHLSKGAGNGASRNSVWCSSSSSLPSFTFVTTTGYPAANFAVNAFVGAPCFILS